MLIFKRNMDDHSRDVYRENSELFNVPPIRVGTIMWHSSRSPRIVINGAIPGLFLSLLELEQCVKAIKER